MRKNGMAFPTNWLPLAPVQIKSFHNLIVLLRRRRPRRAFHEPQIVNGVIQTTASKISSAAQLSHASGIS